MDIRAIVSDIQKSQVVDKEKHFFDIYPEFAEKYPMFFKIACSETIDLPTLNFMLNTLDKMTNKETTEYNASAQVGQMLFDKYVDPKINNKKT